MKKYNFDIEINSSNQVYGGFLMTIKNKTEKQVAVKMEKKGREFLRNNPDIDHVSFSAWESDTKDFYNCAHVGVILSRNGRRINVISY